MPQPYRDLIVSAPDGLKLYARDYGPLHSAAVAVLCLPGLARTSADFHTLALALSGDEAAPRRVLAVDYRGRGRSGRDPDPRRYDPRVELDDLLQVVTVAGLESAVVIGTSRGGLLAMGLSAIRPAFLKAVVLNDVGPVIEAAGIARIRAYVGRLPKPGSHAEAVSILQGLMGSQFPRLSQGQWDGMARATWRETADGLEPDYDPALLKSLETVDLDAALPMLWSLFQGLTLVPVLAIRGANSDLLSDETLRAMAAAHPRLEAVTVPDQGHAPLFEGDLLERVRAFIVAQPNAAPAG
ncbi:MAG TPA: alpha/beta hydrolase [Microvirga sp.]|jgi:pimeloyl-ACP methyl ester carboxylesterase